MIHKVENITSEQLERIAYDIGTSFVNNNMFDCFGDIQERRKDVLSYMQVYVEYAYKNKCLYANDDYTGFIAIEDSKYAKLIPALIVLFKLIKRIDTKKLRKMMLFSNEVSNNRYMTIRHLDIMLLSVNVDKQGNGKASELIDFAKEMADHLNLPLLFDTTMERYKEIYLHKGCILYHSTKTKSGITRYNLVYNDHHL